MITSTRFTWRLVTSGVPLGMALGSILLIFISVLNDAEECILCMCEADTKLGGVTD